MKLKFSLVHGFAVLLSGGIFILDLNTRLGVADGVSYIAVVLLTAWVTGPMATWTIVFLATTLNILGYFFSPAGESPEIVVMNRFLAGTGILASGFLINKFKEVKERSDRQRNALSTLIENATEGIIMTDDAYSIILSNPSVDKMLCYSPEELKSQKLQVVSPEPLNFLNEIMNSISLKKNLNTDTVFKTKQGTLLDVNVGITSYFTNEGRRIIVFVKDISVRKRQEKDLKLANEELIRQSEELKISNNELQNFAYISSHDLQEPLRKIQAFGDRLKISDSQNLSPEGLDYLHRIQNAAGRMQRLINDLLSFSRVSTKTNPFQRIDLNDVMNGVISDLEVLIEKSGAVVKIDEFPSIEGDPTQIRQLFQNLISNAVKFKKNDINPVLEVSRHIKSVNGEEFLHITFRDNGIGFEEKYSDRIFNIFQRLDGNKYEGNGIGLTICRKIAKRHGGNVVATSVPGKGSEFLVTLKLNHKNQNHKTEYVKHETVN